jgi:excisionase family DNA binding protein
MSNSMSNSAHSVRKVEHEQGIVRPECTNADCPGSVEMESDAATDARSSGVAECFPGGLIRRIKPQLVPNQRLFAVRAAAQYVGISDDTLRKYADLGRIPVYRFMNGHRVFKLEDLNRLIDDLPLWNDRASDTARAGRD